MASKPSLRRGKKLMENKGELLKLGTTIASRKELDIRQRIDRTKGPPGQQIAGNRSKSGADRLRAAKEAVVARKIKHKREKRRMQEERTAIGNGHSRIRSSPTPRRVSFA